MGTGRLLAVDLAAFDPQADESRWDMVAATEAGEGRPPQKQHGVTLARRGSSAVPGARGAMRVFAADMCLLHVLSHPVP